MDDSAARLGEVSEERLAAVCAPRELRATLRALVDSLAEPVRPALSVEDAGLREEQLLAAPRAGSCGLTSGLHVVTSFPIMVASGRAVARMLPCHGM